MKGLSWVTLFGLALGCSETWVVEPSSLATVDVISTDSAVGGDVENSQKLSGLCDGPWDCDDGNSCTYDACLHDYGKNQDVCYYILSREYCDDGNPCTTGDVCEFGSCLGGKLTSCKDDDACTVDSCNVYTGCTNTPKNCSDDSVWTVDSCNNGVCKAEQLMIWFDSDIESGFANSKPPVTSSPVVFFGEENAPGANPFDAWTAHALAGTVPSFFLKSFCNASNPLLNKPLFDTGYVIQEDGWVTEHKFLGGHHLNVKIVTFQGLYASTLWNGEQPVLLPQSGTQEFANGMAIPQHYVSPNLKSICAKLKAEQKKLE